jgi:hypothetical protein
MSFLGAEKLNENSLDKNAQITPFINCCINILVCKSIDS